MGMQLIEHIEVGSGGASSILFQNIDGTAQHLVCVVSARGGGSVGDGMVLLSLNSDFTNSNYATGKMMLGNGYFKFSNSDYPRPAAYMPDNSYYTGIFATTNFFIANYASSSYKETLTEGISESNTAIAYQSFHTSTWNNTSAVTSLLVGSSRSGFVEHSTASLYLITD